MRRNAFLGAVLCATLLLGASRTFGAEPEQLAGTWIGKWKGFEMEWKLNGRDRVRVDGRPGNFEIRSDTLIVHFDPLDPNEPEQAETAVYRFLASHPSQVPAQMFIYGFDLGNGVSLQRVEPPAEEPAPATASVRVDSRHARNAGAAAPAVEETSRKKARN